MSKTDKANETSNCNICPDYRYIGHGLYECNAYGECPYIKKEKKKKRRISNE